MICGITCKNRNGRKELRKHEESVDEYQPRHTTKNETAEMILMVWAALWMRELEYIIGYAEEIGGHGDLLYKKNAASAVDGAKDERRAGYHNTAETIKVPASRFEGKNLGARARGRLGIKFMDDIETLLACCNIREVFQLSQN